LGSIYPSTFANLVDNRKAETYPRLFLADMAARVKDEALLKLLYDGEKAAP